MPVLTSGTLVDARAACELQWSSAELGAWPKNPPRPLGKGEAL